jgi:hypothetical protein
LHPNFRGLAMLDLDVALALDPSLLMHHAGLEPDTWQQDLLRSSFTRQLLLCSRQSGKSTTTAFLALHEAIYRKNALVLMLSPSLRQSQELFRKALHAYSKLPIRPPAVNESSLRLELSNGSRIVGLPGREETIRGFSGVTLLIIDEAARVTDDLYYSVRPMIAVSSGRLICLSTPFGRQGFFYEEWTQGDSWSRLKITADQCPRISPEFLAEERKALGPHRFSQEYFCEFLETSYQVFGRDLVMSAFDQSVAPLFVATRNVNDVH